MHQTNLKRVGRWERQICFRKGNSMSDKVIRNGIPVVFFVLLFIHPIVNSADYILDTPGAKLTLKGTTDIVGIDTYAIIQTQLTKDPQIRKDSSEKWIIHENRTTVGDQQDKIQLKAYVIKPDGIYCVAHQKKPINLSKSLVRNTKSYQFLLRKMRHGTSSSRMRVKRSI